jgi:RHS repeat-associated protein
VSTITQADSTTINHAYDLHGRQTFVSGSGTYPVRYVYDDYGELWKMHTFRSGTPTAESTGDVTTWTRDPATGILLSKTDAAAKGVSTTYDPASGRVWKRTLARTGAGGVPITITYAYDDAGRLTSIDYSDATPDVTHTYYTDGRLKTTLDAAGLHTYDYSGPNGALKGETISGTGLLAGSSWSTTFDTANRVDVYTWAWTGAGSRSIDYDYDSAGRLWKVTAFGQSATYGYHAATGRKETLTYSGAGLTGTWTHDTRGRLDALDWKVGANVISRHDYGFDALHRRTSAERENGETWRYDYNDRGEVESAVKKVSNAETAAAKRGLQSGYGYDLIGNRIMDQQHTPSSGNGLSEAVWTANALNQITARENHDSRWVFGHVKQAASLTVTGNSGEVIREGDEFAIPLSRTGAGNAADWHSLDVTATLAGVGRVVDGTALDVTTQRHGKVWFPTSPEDLQYDDDGNLTQDGRWNFTWNAENRLICAETRADVATATGMPRMRLDMAYDAMGRRIRKVVQSFSSTDQAWQMKSDLRFLYEGMSWNLVAELNLKPETSNLELVRSYAWGTDISGTMDGAGGVGGQLIQRHYPSSLIPQPSSGAYAPTYDGNGNITELINLANGSVSARYEYGAFGETISVDGGTVAEANPFRFSTKYLDGETGLLYYTHRYYDAANGRWLSRDPIEENGGVNQCGFVDNDALNYFDYLGEDKNRSDPPIGSNKRSDRNAGPPSQPINLIYDLSGDISFSNDLHIRPFASGKFNGLTEALADAKARIKAGQCSCIKKLTIVTHGPGGSITPADPNESIFPAASGRQQQWAFEQQAGVQALKEFDGIMCKGGIIVFTACFANDPKGELNAQLEKAVKTQFRLMKNAGGMYFGMAFDRFTPPWGDPNKPMRKKF